MFLDFVFSVFSVCFGSTEEMFVFCMCDVNENKLFWMVIGCHSINLRCRAEMFLKIFCYEATAEFKMHLHLTSFCSSLVCSLPDYFVNLLMY